MTSPVPSVSQGTPYGKRGPYWSCSRDAYGNGIHTGCDYPGAQGAPVVAARGGTVEYVNFGSAFGSKQMVVKPGDGTRDFYAHMSSRAVGNGAKVKTGQRVGSVGAEGNVTGPHLHFERHGCASGGWSCNIIRDPAPSIKYASDSGKDDDMPLSESDLEKIASKVNHVLGDFHADGKQRDGSEGERANQRLAQIENVVRDIQKRVKKLGG